MIMPGYDFLKSQVLSCWRKVESVCDVVISLSSVKEWMPGYAFLKSQVLSCWRKVESVCDVVISLSSVKECLHLSSTNNQHSGWYSEIYCSYEFIIWHIDRVLSHIQSVPKRYPSFNSEITSVNVHQFQSFFTIKTTVTMHKSKITPTTSPILRN